MTFQIVSANYDENGNWQNSNIRADGIETEAEAIAKLFRSLAQHVTGSVERPEYRTEHRGGFTRYFVRQSNWLATLETLTPATDNVMKAPESW